MLEFFWAASERKFKIVIKFTCAKFDLLFRTWQKKLQRKEVNFQDIKCVFTEVNVYKKP